MPGPDDLVKVFCPGIRQRSSGRHICRDVLGRVPPSWTPARVRVLDTPHQCSGMAELRYCRRCGSWLEVAFEGLHAA